MKKLIISLCILLLCLTACQGRSVKRLVALSPTEDTSITTEAPTVQEPLVSTESTTDTLDPVAVNEVTTEVVSEADITTEPATTSTVTTEAKTPVIVAKSEDLADTDELTMILNEIDELLDSTLNNLDALEEDTVPNETIIDENNINEGGQ